MFLLFDGSSIRWFFYTMILQLEVPLFEVLPLDMVPPLNKVPLLDGCSIKGLLYVPLLDGT